MRTISSVPMCHVIVPVVMAAALFVTPPIASAQGLGVGARMAWVTADSDADDGSVRFTGGQVRLLASRWGFEASMDRHSETFDVPSRKVTETPIQVSLLTRLGGGSVSPFLLGGYGWYRRSVEPLDGSDAEDVDSTETGWHAGGGLEILAGRHFGIHGDYRYTFLDFDDDEEDEGFIGGLLPGHRGSMWTIGATIYF